MDEKMDKLKILLEETLNGTLRGMILSGPRRKEEIQKIRVRPILRKNQLLFQETLYQNGKVFHKNFEEREMRGELLRQMENFRQMELDNDLFHATVLVSKKGTVTVKKKLRQEAGPGPDLAHNRKNSTF